MATLLRVFLIVFMFLDSLSSTQSLGIGINYGRIADNLPSPSLVASLVGSLNINRVKIYDADPNVLSAFANTNIEFVIGIGNEHLERMTDPAQAQSWVQQNVQPFIPRTKIKCITVGNEILTGNDNQLKSYLLPAMRSVNAALQNLGLGNQICVTTPHSFDVLSNSYPPSAGSFRQDLAEYIHGILDFHSINKSPFFINAYPFFAYMGDPGRISLDYVLFQPNPGMTDPGTGLHYDNMLYAQIDSVYAAIRVMGFTDIQVKVSETGWPSKGDPNEIGASSDNAKLYNGNLFTRVAQNQGTPGKPMEPVDVYIFALFNEDLKPGPLSERNYGLYYPDETPVYNIGSQGQAGRQGHIPRMSYSGSWRNVVLGLNLLLPIVFYWCG